MTWSTNLRHESMYITNTVLTFLYEMMMGPERIDI